MCFGEVFFDREAGEALVRKARELTKEAGRKVSE